MKDRGLRYFEELQLKMQSVEYIEDGFYRIDYKNDYNYDTYMEANISSIDEFILWIMKTQFYNVPITIDYDSFGCATFASMTTDGNHLFGRNFDYYETDALLVHASPEDGYESYAMADLNFLGIGGESGISEESIGAKALMLVAPYACMDGVNEMGVVVEWLGNEMIVVDSDCCTNHLLCENNYDFGDEFPRFETMCETLEQTSGILTQEDAIKLLEEVSSSRKDTGTQWSCVYDLDEFTVRICLDGNYSTVISIR